MSYPKKTSRETILEAAIGLIESNGVDELSMRSLAAQLGVTPNALYRYFASKQELEVAMADEAGKMMLAAMQKAVGTQLGLVAVRAVAKTYLKFARQRPALYALKMRYCKDENDEPDSHKQLWDAMLALVAGMQGPWPLEDLAVTLWAYLHGLVALDQADLLEGRKPEVAVEVGLDVFLAGLMASQK
jgi:AcrR family transcriptional regulator